MKLPGKIALITTGLGMLSLAVVATKGVLAQSAPSTPVDSAVVSAVTPSATMMPAPMPMMMGHHQEKLDATAKLLGITTTQLQTELQSGQEFYQIAAAHGVTYDKLKANREAQFKARLDDMVKVGYITKDESATMLQQYQTQSQTMPLGGMMGFSHHGGEF
ncbi:MAG: hypothetical protein HY092_02525 [Candidatus Kerfeldbacteria bacterium]|nr:hypothetical protein [Candidatus Kerfeldbacteria bacterium]